MSIRPKIRISNRFVFAADLIITAATILLSFAIRFEGLVFFFYLPVAYWMIGISLVVKPIVYYFFGLYRRIWAYASTRELILITYTVTIASAVMTVVTIIFYSSGLISPGLPRSIFIIDWLLSVIAIGGFRFALRLFTENRPSAYGESTKGSTKNVLVIGAGDAGALVVREMQKNPQLNLEPVGYLDDDPSKQKQQIYGVKVVGKLSDLGRILNIRRVDEVIIAIPSAGGNLVRQISDICRLKDVAFRTMPGIFELIGGKVSVTRLREVDITDLLRRQPTRMDSELVGNTLKGKRILITGAGGSIGRELCRQISLWEPAELAILGHGENSIFETMLELISEHPTMIMKPIIADIRDLPRMRNVFQSFKPEAVFHAAAHKHVPMMETNIEDAISNNIIGTQNVVKTCLENDVQRLVMISTDKAIRPISVMGATKRMAEMIVLDAANKTKHAYSIVRFGNVLGSRGSVVPLFKNQIAKGGPVTITHPEMTRYFMTIPEAVHLVLQASAMGKGGEVFLLNMGKPVRILDLAEDLIRLSGLEPGKDIEITYTGIRPGEKLNEDLWEEGIHYQPTDHSEIYRLAEEEDLVNGALTTTIMELEKLATTGNTSAILDLLDSTIPSSNVRVMSSPDITSVV
ncbi:MAG TPA: nucleoside-diphosphate sugar epimerase/dehydratase [Anaerolineales bacterium]|nr:nucleoside-diphosphate sugar epimerase/dehydratase [Anaerolineales bacterium]